MWSQLIKQYWQVSLLKDTPANTPYSPLLLGLVAFIYYILNLMQWSLVETDELFSIDVSLLAGLMFIASDAIYTAALLFVSSKANRIVQSLTCLLACHAIVHICAFPLLIIAPWLYEAHLIEPLGLIIGILYLSLTLMFTAWQLLITVHIYKHALAVDYLTAALASLGLLACNILMVSFWR